MASGQFRTSNDLITEVLANLGVLVAGQSPDPEDFNYVFEKLDAIVRLLAGLEIAYIADVNNIPGVFFSPLADCVTGECATKFGATGDEYVKLINKGIGGAAGSGVDVGAGTGAKMLKIIQRARPSGETLQLEYF